MVVVFVVATLFLLAPTQTPAQQVVAQDTALSEPMASVRSALAGTRLVGARWPNIGDVAPDARRAYDTWGWTPRWSSRGRPTGAARDVIRFVASLDSLGLDPRDYDADTLTSMAAAGDLMSEAQAARFELTLTVSTIRVLSALRWGRVRQPHAYPTLKRTRDDYDLAAGLYATARSAAPIAVLSAAQPQWAAYQRLTAALPRVRRIARDSLFVAPLTAVKPGARFLHAPALRTTLRLLGALPDSLRHAPIVDTLYQPDLVAAVRRFQRSVKRLPNGVFDVATRRAMLTAVEQQIRNAPLALERWRWLPRQAAGRALVVNVPAFRLQGFENVGADTAAAR